jgi:hypothetical protein
MPRVYGPRSTDTADPRVSTGDLHRAIGEKSELFSANGRRERECGRSCDWFFLLTTFIRAL